MWGVRKQGRKQKGSRERKQSRGGNKKPNKKLPPPFPPIPIFFIPHSPPFPPSSIPAKAGISRLQRHRREFPAKGGKNGRFPFSREWRILFFSPNSPNPSFFHSPHFFTIPDSPHPPPFPPIPIPAKAGISRLQRQRREFPAKGGKNGRFPLSREWRILFFSPNSPHPSFFHSPHFFTIPDSPIPQSPPYPHSRESGNLPTPAPLARIPRQRRAKTKSPPKAGNPPRSPYPLRAEKKYPPRPLIVPPRPRLTKKQHQSAFFCILLRFGRQKMVFYRVMGVPPASEAHLFRHWRNK